jgi:hypothetical protein
MAAMPVRATSMIRSPNMRPTHILVIGGARRILTQMPYRHKIPLS